MSPTKTPVPARIPGAGFYLFLLKSVDRAVPVPNMRALPSNYAAGVSMPLNEHNHVTAEDNSTASTISIGPDFSEFLDGQQRLLPLAESAHYAVALEPPLFTDCYLQPPAHLALTETLSSLKSNGHANNQLVSLLVERTTSIEADLSVVLSQQRQLISTLNKVLHALHSAGAQNQSNSSTRGPGFNRRTTPIGRHSESQNVSRIIGRDVILPPESPPLSLHSGQHLPFNIFAQGYPDYRIPPSMFNEEPISLENILGPVQHTALWNLTEDFC
ncbi:hypothetical protein HYPSUDRAFT_59063 [Hypholoma sublateritium FD-334 SS-4]|uniref:Uncharacterized protein n=1 Tax=Hypholoma sublateritium (strain FD-334 SS-4) TaxID=945553 RepID=A0A0D2LVU7_HYPSF|nr:hypothetical protein HYPSUDRAFT_59063 [Hypholoma sublateritium FD-334 SS-4]